MKKIISLSIEENLLKKIDKTRGYLPRSRLIEMIITNWVVNRHDEINFKDWELPQALEIIKENENFPPCEEK